ncbi:hypothetical protein GCM10007860_27080 [Chitiniphilus shinanonensis]|uniref:Lipoprotein n=1 Tax=Chitiniphilus shinanonensis TaxID=553088 RepID=A0ABQ6BVN3_9NEIS|nr:hypothetical protein [Chitiniphilus shinanonensis]GLS05554.1 hypothetical protein GCM10007860_27080 [Chitiniphilus shinanonensis]
MQVMLKHCIVGVAGLIILGAAVLVTHQYTKVAYHAVGFNDGIIDSNMRVLNLFTEVSGSIPVCTAEQQYIGKVIVSVKAEAIYAISKGSNVISLCKAQ